MNPLVYLRTELKQSSYLYISKVELEFEGDAQQLNLIPVVQPAELSYLDYLEPYYIYHY